MDTVLISMVGHQTLPNLLTIRYLNPNYVLFLHSAASDVLQRKRYLVDLLPERCREIPLPSAVDPWDIRSIPQMLPDILRRRKLDEMNLFFDLTGGTKAMSLGLAHVAAQLPNATMIYVESAQGDSILYRYKYNDRGELQRDDGKVLPDLLELDQFFHVYLGPFDSSPQPNLQQDINSRQFEEDVASGFTDITNLEMRRSVKPQASEEIDIVLRCRNQVALVECKIGGAAKGIQGVLQLSNLASDRYLGTYTRKILAVQSHYGKDSSNNAEAARRHDVFVLELPNWELTRERQPNGKIIWTKPEIEEFKKALTFVFGSGFEEVA